MTEPTVRVIEGDDTGEELVHVRVVTKQGKTFDVFIDTDEVRIGTDEMCDYIAEFPLKVPREEVDDGTDVAV